MNIDINKQETSEKTLDLNGYKHVRFEDIALLTDKIQNIKHNVAKNSYFMINNFSRPLTNDKSRNKDKYIINKLKQLKTFNKNHAKLFGNGIIEDESINSDNEKRKISSKKKKPIKERETSDYERFWIDEVNAKLMKKEEGILKYLFI